MKPLKKPPPSQATAERTWITSNVSIIGHKLPLASSGLPLSPNPNGRPATPNTCSTTLAVSELRWSAPSEGGLFELGRRVPGRGEYRGLTFHEIEAKSILNRVPGDYLPFDWTINPYRGCSHACVYCFARPTHEYLGFDIADEFDSQIVVKINAVELARAETSPALVG